MTQEERDDGLNRFNDAPDGPTVNIYGKVKWPEEWTNSDKTAWIRLEREIHNELYPGHPINPDGDIAVLEYDLNPSGCRPDYLGALRKQNPHLNWPDTPKPLVDQVKTTMSDALVSVLDVAAYILKEYASVIEMHGGMTAMKLQKLVYYCQAKCLASGKGPLFKERIEAWRDGPVVRELFDQHRGEYLVHGLEPGAGDPGKLSKAQQEMVDLVFKNYGHEQPEVLAERTHEELPWINARIGLGPNERGDTEISHKDMEEYYSSI